MREPLILLTSLALTGALAMSGCAADMEDSAGGIGAGGSETGPGLNGGGGPTSGPPPGPAAGPPTSDGEGRDVNAGEAPAPDALLAGVWDDNLNFSPWHEAYVAAYDGYRPDDPKLSLAGRSVIQLETPTGDPIANAEVEVLVTDGEPVSLGLTTTAGKVLLLPDLDAVSVDENTILQITLPSLTPMPVPIGEVTEDGWSVVVETSNFPSYLPTMPTALDLAFVIDTTGSLGDEIAYLQSRASYIADWLTNSFNEVSVRYALIAYRDEGDPDYVVQAMDFTQDFSALNTELNALEAAGGGDYPEALDQALGAMHQLSWTDGNVARMAFVIADAPAHQSALKEVIAHSRSARETGIRVYPIGASGTGDQAMFFMRQSALLTQGRYLFLLERPSEETPDVDATAPGNMPCFHAQALEDTITQMIASELTGQLAPVTAPSLPYGDPSPQGVCSFGNDIEAQTSPAAEPGGL